MGQNLNKKVLILMKKRKNQKIVMLRTKKKKNDEKKKNYCNCLASLMMMTILKLIKMIPKIKNNQNLTKISTWNKLEKLVQKKAAKPKKTRPTRGKKRKNPVTDEEALTEEMRPKKKKNPPGKRTEEELNGIILSFIDKMKTADQDDSFCMMNRKPATNRLKLLPEVQRYMANIEFQPYFIRYNILEDLAHWIAPREDKSLPNIRFREVILSILNQVQMEYLTSDTLRESGIGKMVYLYSVHSKETPQNKKLASSILNKWMRPLYGNTDDYEEPPERAPKVSRKRVKKPHRQLASFDNGDDDDDERSSYQHRIPQRQRFEFRINPQSNFSSEPTRRREPSQTQRSIDRQINLLKAKGRK